MKASAQNQTIQLLKKHITKQQKKIYNLTEKLRQKDTESVEYKRQLQTIVNTVRWKVLNHVCVIGYKIGIFPLVKMLLKPLKRQEKSHSVINPYHAIDLLKKIPIDVIEKDYHVESIHMHFSSATTIYQEEKGIISFLSSIERQSLKPNEVVLVDGGSTDKTILYVEQFMKNSSLKIKLYTGKHFNIPQGRNFAIQKAKNEIIALADAGTILDIDYFKNLIGCMEEYKDADLVGGIFYPLKKSQYSSNHLLDWDHLDWNNHLPSTRSMVLKKSLAKKVGLYPEYLKTGDDTLFDIAYRKFSNHWVFNKKAIVLWDSPQTKEQSIKLAENYGRGDGESGIGDFFFYAYLALEKKHLPIPDPLSRLSFYKGYIKGRQRRSKLDIENRHITGIVVIFANYYINDRRERNTLRFVQQYIKKNYKVIYVNLFPSKEGFFDRKCLDLDYSLLELYHIDDFSLSELMERYKEVQHNTFFSFCSSNAKYAPFIEDAHHYPGTTLLQIDIVKISMKEYSLSQDCQIPDLGTLLQSYLGYKTRGFFVEIGAYDGETHSNTSFLADIGWRGVYVEPIPLFANKCSRRHSHNNVTVIQQAVGKTQGKATLSIGGELSTTMKSPKDFYVSIGFPEVAKQHTGRKITVNQTTLNAILAITNAPISFDLLVIDTESTEWEILSTFSIRKWQPKMVIIEMHEKSTDWTKSQLIQTNNKRINAYFNRAGYLKIYSDTINTVFIKRTPKSFFLSLIQRFDSNPATHSTN